jgi:hypothetical protein
MKTIYEIEFTRKKILRQSAVRETWLCSSSLHNSSCISESKLELDYFFSMLFDEGLLDILSQPQTFKEIRYTPDFYLRYSDKIFFIEVKYFKATQTDDFKNKTEIREAFFEGMGAEYKVVTERTIRASNLPMNSRIIIAGLKHPKPIAEFERIKKMIPHCNMSISKLTQLLLKKKCKPCFIRRALAHRVISVDLTPRWSEIQINW